jgi:hypothetical protein
MTFFKQFRDSRQAFVRKTITQYRVLSRPEIGLHELTCKQDEKIGKNRSRTGSDNC